MKCPKCGYISFDYNQVCPKCSKDISAEQAKLNIPAFRPETPYFLEALTGEANESSTGIGMGTSTGVDTGEYGMGAGFDDSGAFDTEEVEFGDSIEMDEGDIHDEPVEESVSAFDFEELETPAGEEEVTLEESVTDYDLESDEEEITMEMGDFSEEEPEAVRTATPEPSTEEDEFGIDLDDVSLDDFDDAQASEEEKVGVESEAAGPDLDSSALELEDISPETDLSGKEEEEDIAALDLDDLNIDDSEELKVDTGEEAPENEDLSLDLDDLDIELDLDKPEEKPS